MGDIEASNRALVSFLLAARFNRATVGVQAPNGRGRLTLPESHLSVGGVLSVSVPLSDLAEVGVRMDTVLTTHVDAEERGVRVRISTRGVAGETSLRSLHVPGSPQISKNAGSAGASSALAILHVGDMLVSRRVLELKAPLGRSSCGTTFGSNFGLVLSGCAPGGARCLRGTTPGFFCWRSITRARHEEGGATSFVAIHPGPSWLWLGHWT